MNPNTRLLVGLVGRFVVWSVGRLVGWSVCWLVDRSVLIFKRAGSYTTNAPMGQLYISFKLSYAVNMSFFCNTKNNSLQVSNSLQNKLVYKQLEVSNFFGSVSSLWYLVSACWLVGLPQFPKRQGTYTSMLLTTYHLLLVTLNAIHLHMSIYSSIH